MTTRKVLEEIQQAMVKVDEADKTEAYQIYLDEINRNIQQMMARAKADPKIERIKEIRNQRERRAFVGAITKAFQKR